MLQSGSIISSFAGNISQVRGIIYHSKTYTLNSSLEYRRSIWLVGNSKVNEGNSQSKREQERTTTIHAASSPASWTPRTFGQRRQLHTTTSSPQRQPVTIARRLSQGKKSNKTPNPPFFPVRFFFFSTMPENRKYLPEEITYVISRTLAGWKHEAIAEAFKRDHAPYWDHKEFTRKQVNYIRNTYKIPPGYVFSLLFLSSWVVPPPLLPLVVVVVAATRTHGHACSRDAFAIISKLRNVSSINTNLVRFHTYSSIAPYQEPEPDLGLQQQEYQQQYIADISPLTRLLMLDNYPTPQPDAGVAGGQASVENHLEGGHQVAPSNWSNNNDMIESVNHEQPDFYTATVCLFFLKKLLEKRQPPPPQKKQKKTSPLILAPKGNRTTT